MPTTNYYRKFKPNCPCTYSINKNLLLPSIDWDFDCKSSCLYLRSSQYSLPMSNSNSYSNINATCFNSRPNECFLPMSPTNSHSYFISIRTLPHYFDKNMWLHTFIYDDKLDYRSRTVTDSSNSLSVPNSVCHTRNASINPFGFHKRKVLLPDSSNYICDRPVHFSLQQRHQALQLSERNYWKCKSTNNCLLFIFIAAL